jgi:kinesin family protein 4/21/27
MTTMIACVSPLEYNISETINTINYASRARKIKNQVSKNQTEVGWDDIEYLRNQVVKLRAKIANADGGDAPTRRDAAAIDDDALQRQIIELTDKLADLEDEFSHLQDQYFQKCREIVALSDPDLLEDDKLRQFNETIEPVVLE